MTATPRFYTPRLRKEAGLLDVEVASMDDERVFGPVLHRLTFGEAIDRDLLSDYQVVVIGVDNEMYRALAEHGEFVTPDGESITDARTLAGQIALVKAMRKYELRRVISFHSRVNAARKFSDDVPYVSAWMPARARPRDVIWSDYVSGAMPSGHRDRVLLRFRNIAADEIGLLSNARCLGEGVDVPGLDGVAFIDPRRSPIDIIQALGRAIRKSPRKKLGTIVLPVFLSDDEDPDRVLDESAFKHVWDVLKALRAHDEALGDELDALRHGLGARRLPPPRPGKIKLDIPAGRVGAAFIRAFNLRVVEQTTVAWEFWLGLLERFLEREGHSRVPTDHREDGYQLGYWVATQRAFHRRGHLSAARARRLEALSGWTWNALDAAWEDGFAHLLGFVSRESHARVPQNTDEDGYPLGNWVLNQRAFHRRGALGADRERRLEEIPGWTWDTLTSDWEDGFAHLKQFVNQKGHARVSQTAREDGYRLGQWTSNQRHAYAKGILDPVRRRRLEALPGWTWDTLTTSWEEAYGYLVRFVEREGHARVPTGHLEDSYPLGTWVGNQARPHRKGTLTPDRRARLERLPGWTWDRRELQWEEGFANLQKFVEREGHARVPRGDRENGQKLSQWVIVQRQAHRKGTLDSVRRARLERLPGWTWDAREADWEEGFARLQRFAEREGHARVPQHHEEATFRLGGWVYTQRQRRRRGTLDAKKAARLESLPGWTWHPHEADWEEKFACLRKFVEREGHARVPHIHREDGIRLGSWVDNQRRLYLEGTLERQRRARLEAQPRWDWAPYRTDWEEGFARLQRFAERQGSCRVPRSYEDDDGFRLGQWVGDQRARGRRGELSDERARRLESVPGWTWDARQPAQAR